MTEIVKVTKTFKECFAILFLSSKAFFGLKTNFKLKPPSSTSSASELFFASIRNFLCVFFFARFNHKISLSLSLPLSLIHSLSPEISTH